MKDYVTTNVVNGETHLKVQRSGFPDVTNVFKCPDPACKELLTPQEVKQLVPLATYQKYEDFLLKTALNEMPDLR